MWAHTRPSTGSQLPLDLGDQDHTRAARQAAVQRDPAGVAAHHLDHDDAAVRCGRGVQPIEALRHHRDGRVKPERLVREAQIVVDRLRDADARQPVQREIVRDRHRAVAADAHDALQPQRAERFYRLGRGGSILVPGRKGPAVGRAEHRAADGEQPIHHQPVQMPPLVVHETFEPVMESHHADPAPCQRLHHGADHRVQPRRVASSCQKPHFFAPFPFPIQFNSSSPPFFLSLSRKYFFNFLCFIFFFFFCA
jgi:hypothetical protein